MNLIWNWVAALLLLISWQFPVDANRQQKVFNSEESKVASLYAESGLWQIQAPESKWTDLIADIERLGLDLWSVQVQDSSVQVLMHDLDTNSIESVKGQLSSAYQWTEIMTGNEITGAILKERHDAENLRAELASSSSSLTESWFQQYHRFDEIREWFESLAKDYPDLVTFIPSIGKTHEGRDIFAVHITDKQVTRVPKQKIWFQGQIHAREWISGATVQYVAHQLIVRYGQDGQEDVTQLLKRLEFVIVPCMNPDGFEHTHHSARLWRKNRRDNGRLQGMGVDLNRNFDSHWDDDGGASRMPGSETYKGPHAASEPEVQAITQYFLKQARIVGAIDFHSFSQLILRPYGHSREEPPHQEQLKLVGDTMRDLIYEVHQKSYTSIASIGLYPTTGTASDWFYDSPEVIERMNRPVYGYTIELRPASALGAGGFLLPPKEIIPTGEEIFPAIVFFAQYASENPLQKV